MAGMVILLDPHLIPLELPNICATLKLKHATIRNKKKFGSHFSNYAIFNEISGVQMIQQNYKLAVGRLSMKSVMTRILE